MIDYRRLRKDLLALGLLAAIVFLALSLYSFDPADPPTSSIFPPNAEVQNACGPVGAQLAAGLHRTLGWGSYVLLVTLFLFNLRLFSREEIVDPLMRIVGWSMTIAALCTGLHVLVPQSGIHIVGSGGYLGAFGATVLMDHFSTIGSLIFITTILVSGMLLAAESCFVRLVFRPVTWPLRATGRLLFRRSRSATSPEAPLTADEPEPALPKVRRPVETACVTRERTSTPVAAEARPIKVNPPAGSSLRDKMRSLLPGLAATRSRDEYELPALSLLEPAEDFPFDRLAEKAQGCAATLEKTFEEFGLNVKVSEIDTGPVVTQYELNLEPGLRVSKVTALQDDLAIALRVPAVRVVSPIPGKNTVGVEVPNGDTVMVRLRELIEVSEDKLEKVKLPLFLGKDVSGRPLIVDLSKMPHLLIAGRTGTGKSVCLNTLIVSLLMTRSPDDVKMLMIDPKMVELSPYMRIPHLMHPVITDMKKAEAVLAWAVDKMEERYDLLARAHVRHLDGYNKLGKEKVLERMGIDPDDPEADDIPEHMPFIVIIADEMADMMMTSGKDVEGHIIRLAQKSRAVGIHLVLATQKPTVDIITGLIKSNLPARISFQVSSRTDSRVVLDECGAERLLGNGDMLYLAPGTSTLTRAQGTYVSDDEVHQVIEFFSDMEPEYSAEIDEATSRSNASPSGLDAIRDRDELFTQACEVVIREGRGSCSLLQRALSIGYGRASRMIDYMAEDGIVGPYNGSKHREVNYTLEEWEAMQAGEELEPSHY